jgi:hypothetical protein
VTALYRPRKQVSPQTFHAVEVNTAARPSC